MGLNYICSNSTYDLTGSEYTTVFDKKKRLNYIVSGTINQLGLTTDSSASVYSPLKFKLSGDDYYIGRSTTFNTTSSTATMTTATATDYYTLYTATRSGSSNGSNSNMTSTSRYIYSTKASYTANTSSNIRGKSVFFTTSGIYLASKTSTSNRSPSRIESFASNSHYSSKSSTYSEDNLFDTHNSLSGTIGGNGTVNNTYSYKTSTSLDYSHSYAYFTTSYDVYSSKTRDLGNTYYITLSGSRTTSSVQRIKSSIYTYSTYGAYNYTASTYSTRYTSTYTGTISGIPLDATSTKLTYSTHEYFYNTSIRTTTIKSSHNFV